MARLGERTLPAMLPLGPSKLTVQNSLCCATVGGCCSTYAKVRKRSVPPWTISREHRESDERDRGRMLSLNE